MPERPTHEGGEWNAEHEGNKLILLFEGFMYGDLAISEGGIVAAIHRFRTKEPIELNEEAFTPEARAKWQAEKREMGS